MRALIDVNERCEHFEFVELGSPWRCIPKALDLGERRLVVRLRVNRLDIHDFNLEQKLSS